MAITLPEAEARLERNRDVLAARRAAEAATANVAIAGQAPNPTLSWGAVGVDTRNGTGSGRFFDKRIDQTIGVSQLIERGDKRELREAGARALAGAASLDLSDVRRQQRLALHQAYFDLKAAAERVRLLGETVELYEKSLAAAEWRVKVGDLAPVEASRQRIEALRAKSDWRSATADFALARRALAWALGDEAGAEQLSADSDWPAPLALARIDAQLLERRPDVRAASARVDAAQRGRELARSLTRRDVIVGASVERDRSGDVPRAGVTYGLSFSVPLFVRYEYEGEIARAEADYNAALELRERVLAQAGSETARLQALYQAAAERLARIEGESLPEAQRVGAAAELAYAKGAFSLTDLLDARRTQRALALEALAARADHAKARAAWLAATEWELTATP